MPYYIRWLQRFLAGPGSDSRLTAQDAERVFVEHLDRAGDVPEWQVRQAARAVEIYQKHYLGHKSVETTMIYTHVMRGLASTAVSPLDALAKTGS